jgi:hypothetical protein
MEDWIHAARGEKTYPKQGENPESILHCSAQRYMRNSESEVFRRFLSKNLGFSVISILYFQKSLFFSCFD